MARTKRGADGESRVVPDCALTTLPSESDVLSQYETASLEFGQPSKNEKNNVMEVTRKLANDLNEFEAKLGEKDAQAAATYNDVKPEMVEALQLQSCRKLRKVCIKEESKDAYREWMDTCAVGMKLRGLLFFFWFTLRFYEHY